MKRIALVLAIVGLALTAGIAAGQATHTWSVHITGNGIDATYTEQAADQVTAEDQAWAELRASSTTETVDVTPPPALTLDTFQVNADNSITFSWTSDGVTCEVVPDITPRSCAVGGTNTRTTRVLSAGDKVLRLTTPEGASVEHSFTIAGPPVDRDGDGVPDADDQCPDVAGPASNNGCPVVSGDVPPPDGTNKTIYFPRNPQAGFTFDNCGQERQPQNADYTDLDITEHTDALGFVNDPLGSGMPVARYHLGSNADSCQARNGDRSENYQSAETAAVGETYWIGEGFMVPNGQSGIGNVDQLHSHHGGGPPPFVIEWQDGWAQIKTKTCRTGCVTHTHLVQAPTGHWIYVVAQIRLATNETGFYRAWGAVDHLPNVDAAPMLQKSNYVSMYAGGQGYWKSGLYATSVDTLYKCGQSIMLNAADAMSLGTCPL